jgi:hypothetical protein
LPNAREKRFWLDRMKTTPLPRLSVAAILFVGLAALVSLGGTAGCASTGARIQARIDEKPDVFAKLTKQQQKDIKWGYVKRGYTPDMVYFAFGKPDQIIASSDKTSYVWVYLDRAAINQDAAMASALQQGTSADSMGKGAISGSNANFKGSITTGGLSSSQTYSLVDASGNSDMPTIWVAFQNDTVVNVQHIGGHGTTDKSGSLGG